MSREHPTLETLLELTLDELPEREACTLREHLLDCPQCLARVRELIDLPENAPAGQEPISDSQRRAAFERLAASLDAEESSAGSLDTEGKSTEAQNLSQVPDLDPAKVSFAQPVAPSGGFSWRGFAVAASVVAAIGFGFLLQPRNSGETLWPVSQVSAEGSLRVTRGPNTPTRVACPKQDQAAVWGLILTDAPASTEPLRIEIEGPDGAKDSLHGHTVDNFGMLWFGRKPGTTPNGVYEIKVFLDPARDPLETFFLWVDCTEQG